MSEQTNYEKNFTPMPIADLLDGKHHFVIPSFQRGYRWEEKQVVDLLEDIKQFANDDTVRSDSYFLQPIVVKATSYKDGAEQDVEAYEVLDGQQRLTTMLLVLKFITQNLLSPMQSKMYIGRLYDIVYTNRPQLDFDDPCASDNIDSYYLSEAKEVIENWFTEQVEANQNLNDFIGTLLYNQKQQVKIIWYEIDKDSQDLVSISIFNRLNKGKISLTSSELIKALFIMDYELRSQGEKTMAEQLSMEWNEMERWFQNDSFWYFISDDNRGVQTRIDILFDFVTNKGEGTDADYSYREFQKLFDHCRKQERENTNDSFARAWAIGIRNMEDAWKHVRKTFDRLVAWYEDNMYYHYVGYLVAVGFTPLQVYNHLEEAKRNNRVNHPNHEWTVEDNKLALQKMMMEKFKVKNNYLAKDAIDELEYKSEFVPRVLLLFNIECCHKGQNIRFAFDRFKKENWDVEHVDSQNNATLQEFDDRMRWLKNVAFILKLEGSNRAKELDTECTHHAGLHCNIQRGSNRAMELATECTSMIEDYTARGSVVEKQYNDFYTKINKFFAKEVNEKEEEVDLTKKKKDFISNLTLLDSATNREYKDAPFAYKRFCIVSYDRSGDRFIPLCTRNLFLKYFTNTDNESSYLDSMRWNGADRKGYMIAMHEAVDPIFDSIIEKEDINKEKEEQNEPDQI